MKTFFYSYRILKIHEISLYPYLLLDAVGAKYHNKNALSLQLLAFGIYTNWSVLFLVSDLLYSPEYPKDGALSRESSKDWY